MTEPVLRGAVAPDWFYVPGVPPILDQRLAAKLQELGIDPQDLD